MTSTVAEVQLPHLSVDLVERARKTEGEVATWAFERLQEAERRYRMFLALAARNQNIPIAPTRDIDKMWHLHMLCPVAYYEDCQRIFGYILNHNGGLGTTAEEAPILKARFAETARLWEASYGESHTVMESPPPAAFAVQTRRFLDEPDSKREPE